MNNKDFTIAFTPCCKREKSRDQVCIVKSNISVWFSDEAKDPNLAFDYHLNNPSSFQIQKVSSALFFLQAYITTSVTKLYCASGKETECVIKILLLLVNV